MKENRKVLAHIHSLNGEMKEVTIIKENDVNNKYIVEYNGIKCTAIFNIFTCSYYADDIYGIVEE